MSVLQTIDLKKYYGTEPNITRALDGVNFSVEDGEFVAVVGTSGSGKSTLLHMMGGLDTPTSGNVIVRDKELSKMNDEQLTIFRRRNIGFIFQNYNLVPILNVYENIVPPVVLVLVFRQWLARQIRWTVALTALCDVLLFWDELFYYESFGLFAVLIQVQLAATGAAAFRFYYKQRKG